MSPFTQPVVLILLALTALPSLAAEPGRGRLLYENHCLGCHDSMLHIREQRRVDSLAGLQREILRWRDVQGVPWNPQEVEDVLEYLNSHYYGFAPDD